jgi:isochorismate hydrolase
MASVAPRFSPSDSIILRVDHQTMTIDWVKSLPKTTVIASCRVLARMGVTSSIPLVVLTTTMEEYVGPTLPEIQEVAPDAFAARFKRGGTLSCFDQPELVAALKATGRTNLILAGLTTDICLFWAARDAVRLGYNVNVIADACGTMSTIGDDTTFDRLRSLGVTVSVVNQIVTELENDFGTPGGLKAQQILSEEVISKLVYTTGMGHRLVLPRQACGLSLFRDRLE